MKKILCLVLCMMLLMGSAMASGTIRFGDLMEVAKCKEYITLREEPSTKAAELDRVPLGALVRTLGAYDEKFHRVLYDGQAGFVLSEYLGPVQKTLVAYPDVVVSEGTQEAYNIDLFLTNFTEQYFLAPYGYCDAQTISDQELVEFAIEHIWFNRQDYIEWGEWDEYNVRLSADYIPAVCEKYFGRVPESKLALYKDYFDGYYYWTETGGHVPGGFALMHDIECVGVNMYKVSFCVYGQGYAWDDSVYGIGERALVHEHPEYFSEVRPYGTAVFTAEDLLDRSSWKLVSLVMDWERFNEQASGMDWARMEYNNYSGTINMGQTVNDTASLEELRRMILESEPAELGQCPLRGTLTIQMTDGKVYEFTRATDGCPTIVNEDGVVHALSWADSKLFWEIFDEVHDAIVSDDEG